VYTVIALKVVGTTFLLTNKELKILVSVVRFHLWAPCLQYYFCCN